jgi:hypothetical protein
LKTGVLCLKRLIMSKKTSKKNKRRSRAPFMIIDDPLCSRADRTSLDAGDHIIKILNSPEGMALFRWQQDRLDKMCFDAIDKCTQDAIDHGVGALLVTDDSADHIAYCNIFGEKNKGKGSEVMIFNQLLDGITHAKAKKGEYPNLIVINYDAKQELRTSPIFIQQQGAGFIYGDITFHGIKVLEDYKQVESFKLFYESD